MPKSSRRNFLSRAVPTVCGLALAGPAYGGIEGLLGWMAHRQSSEHTRKIAAVAPFLEDHELSILTEIFDEDLQPRLIGPQMQFVSDSLGFIDVRFIRVILGMGDALPGIVEMLIFTRRNIVKQGRSWPKDRRLDIDQWEALYFELCDALPDD